MSEIIKYTPQWELQIRKRIDERVTRTVESGYALPEDTQKLVALANLTKFAINRRNEGAALQFGSKLVRLSDEIMQTPQNIEGKIEKLAV